MSERRTRHGALTRVMVAVTASISLLVGLGTMAFTVRWIQARDVGTDLGFNPTAPSGTPVPPGNCATEGCNYLLLGSDSRSGLPEGRFGTNQDIGGTTRADTIMLVHTDPHLKKAIVVSFPRDLWVAIPGRGHDRINTAFEGGLSHGGPQRVAQAVANLTGLSIDHYLYVDLKGFQRIVDTLGGVHMCIPAYNVNTPGSLPATLPNGEQTTVYYDEVGHIADPNSGLNIEPGCQRLGGDQALAYVRSRHLPCDLIPDFARIGRQQQFLRAVINQMLRPGMVVKAPSLVRPVLLSLHRDRDLRPSDLLYLVGQLRGLSTGVVEFRTVPAVAASIEGKAVLRMDPSAEKIFDAIRQGRPIGNVGTALVNTPPTEANTIVAVVDLDSDGTASEMETILADAGFNIEPGIWSREEASIDVSRAAILYRPSGIARAQVVGAYFPDLPLIESAALRGAQVAIVVPRSYSLVDSGEPTIAPETTDCPSPSQ